jgi:phosphotransferase system  glucose/maltose/N-acetylglucosamine-specific IIC component
MKAFFNAIMGIFAFLLIVGGAYGLGGSACVALVIGLLIMLALIVDSMKSSFASEDAPRVRKQRIDPTV